jgi:predicted metal-binding membrane protein
MGFLRAKEHAFFGISALLFVSSAAITIAWSVSMSAMSGMQMPGGWTMSMMWMRMQTQTWSGAAATFLGMWIVMMMAMMLPALVLMLRQYREVVGWSNEPRLGRLTVLVGIAYFVVWTAFGIAAFALGVASAAIAMQYPSLSRGVPVAAGVVVLIAGFVQFTPWKTRHLACCKEVPDPERMLPATALTAIQHGLRLGLHCSLCCAGLMSILLAMGVMNLGAMVAITAVITIERLAPVGERIEHAIGAIVVGTGMFLIAQAAGLG